MKAPSAALLTFAISAAGAILVASLAGGQGPRPAAQPAQESPQPNAAAPVSPAPHADEAAANASEEAAVGRARKTVRMLDDIYKTAVVLITDKYVHSEDDFPAGSAAVAWFSAISEKGWHTVRLIDATGAPYRQSNTPRDDFERDGVAQLRAGRDYVDAVAQQDGKPVLRALTPVPVVLEKCTMCHANYIDLPPGTPIGAISYTIPIE
jgi:hypothetical protein